MNGQMLAAALEPRHLVSPSPRPTGKATQSFLSGLPDHHAAVAAILSNVRSLFLPALVDDHFQVSVQAFLTPRNSTARTTHKRIQDMRA